MQRGNPPQTKSGDGKGENRVWSARRTVKMKPQQPVGCEDFIKPRNAAIRPYFPPFLPHSVGRQPIYRLKQVAK